MSSLKEFIQCIAERLQRSGVEDSARYCAELLPRETLFAVTGEKGAEEGILPLLEAFMGGVDLRLLSPEAAEKVRDYIREKAGKLKGRRLEAAMLAGYLAQEAVDRLRTGLPMPSPPSPRMVARPLEAAILRGFLWPLAVKPEPTPSLRKVLEEMLRKASMGRIVRVGVRGRGATALLYMTLSMAAEEGWRIVFGRPRKWMRGYKTIVVSPNDVVENFGIPTLVEGAGDYVFGDEYLRTFAEEILEYDGVDCTETGVLSLVEKSGGSPVYLEAASLFARILGRRVDAEFVRKLPGRIEDIVEKTAARIEVSSLPRAKVFPENLLENSLKKRLVEAGVLLRDGERGLLAYRNSVWPGLAGAEPGARAAFEAPNRWWAAAVMASQEYGHETAYYALESLLEGGLEVLDAVASLRPGEIYKLLYSSTSYRIEVIAGKAEEAGFFAAAAELYGLARRVLDVLPSERYGERRARLALKEASAEAKRGFPERAAVVLKEALDMAGTEETKGMALAELSAALASLGEIEGALKAAEESIRIAGGKPEHWVSKAYAVLGAIAEDKDPEKAVENYKKALDVLAQLVYTGRCEYAEDLYVVAERLKKIRGRGDPRVCGGLAKCGLFDLYTLYGC